MGCPICNNENLISINNKLDRCTICQGLFRKNPLEINTEKLIEEVYNASWVEGRKNYFDRTVAEHAIYYEMILRFLKPNKGEILEIGSGTGEFLKLAEKSGWKVTGMEPSKVSSDFIRNNLKINVINSIFDINLFNSERFDVIFFAHVLEHICNPVKFLKEVSTLLKNNGIILLSVPNAKDISYQDENINTELYSERDHIFFYNKDALTNLANIAGLNVHLISSRQTYGDLSRASFRVESSANVERLIELENTLKGYELICVLTK